jgi:hypothetical protein
LVILFAGLAAPWWYLIWAEERDYQAALAETDRLDPGWRIADLEAGRAKIPDERNGALQVLKARRLGAGGSIGMALEQQIGALPLNVPLNAEQTAALRKFFASDPKARAEAHRLKDFPTGRYPPTYDANSTNVNTNWVQQSRELAHYLHLSALLAAQDADAKQLADVCRACINNAHSMGDEPTMIGLLVRVAIMEIALAPLERGMAQVDLPPAELQALQETLQREFDAPRLMWAMRGERAISMDMIEATHDGRLPRSNLVAGMQGWRAWVPNWLPMPLARDRAAYLRGMNAIVEASKQPVEKQLDAMDLALNTWKSRDWLLAGMANGCIKTTWAHARGQARMRCALVALAAERYRQEHDAWPASLETLVQGGQLKAVPLDPFDGQPLRYKRLADGVLVYSVGHDRADDGGNIDRTNPIGLGVDLGFRLYDPTARRRSAGPQ